MADVDHLGLAFICTSIRTQPCTWTRTPTLATANDTIAALRGQLARTEAALDRERAEQHKTVSLLHDLITSRPAAPAGSAGQHPEAAGGAGHEPAAAAGNGATRRQPPR